MTPFKTFLIGAMAVTGATLAAPGDASAGQRDVARIAERLDTIESRVESVRDIRRPGVRLNEIDELQAVLARLERRNADERGRLARFNDRRIDDLQARLARVERRTERRDARRHDSGYGHGGYRR